MCSRISLNLAFQFKTGKRDFRFFSTSLSKSAFQKAMYICNFNRRQSSNTKGYWEHYDHPDY